MGAVSAWWEWTALVFARLDGRDLAAASCVCSSWREVAKQEELWADLCLRAWPGLLTRSGAAAVAAAGGYRKFYSVRQRAFQHSSAIRKPGGLEHKPRLKLKDLLFMLDVQHGDTPVCSFVRSGDCLKPMFPAGACSEQGTFRFVVEIGAGNVAGVAVGTSPRKELEQEEDEQQIWIGRCKWSKIQVKDFSVSWAVMLKGSPKLFQVLHTRQPGQVVGNTCNYSERLPLHSCCCLSETNHVAEVDLYFSRDEQGSGGSNSTGSGAGAGALLFLKELRCSILNTDCWRYFTQAQALQYLQHALLRDCLYM